MTPRFSRHWYRFRPRLRHRHHHYGEYKRRDSAQDTVHLRIPEQVNFICNGTDFFDCAEEEVASHLQRRPELHDLDRDIDRLKKRFERTKQPHDGLVALLSQVPRAVLAQLQMDQFPHGYRNKRERLYELIDFNDTMVNTILVLTDTLRDQFSARTKQAADRICKRVGAPCFTNEQWTAIIRGLTREVAVYQAAVDNGFSAWMTDRSQDALGIDMQVQDPETKRYLNIDVKTPSSFRHRMEQLVHEGRLTERQLLEGDRQNYIVELNGHGTQRVAIVVLCILPDKFGELAEWRFIDSTKMRDMLVHLLREHGLTDNRYGRIF